MKARANFTGRDILARSDLGRGNEEERMHVWLLRASGLFGQVGMFIEAAGTLGQRRAVGVTIAESGITRRPGSIHRLPPHSFDVRGGSNISLISTVGPAIIGIVSGRLSPRRRSAGYSTRRRTHARFRFGAGSFDGPSNTALEPAAPMRSRAPRLSAGR